MSDTYWPSIVCPFCNKCHYFITFFNLNFISSVISIAFPFILNIMLHVLIVFHLFTWNLYLFWEFKCFLWILGLNLVSLFTKQLHLLIGEFTTLIFRNVITLKELTKIFFWVSRPLLLFYVIFCWFVGEEDLKISGDVQCHTLLPITLNSAWKNYEFMWSNQAWSHTREYLSRNSEFIILLEVILYKTIFMQISLVVTCWNVSLYVITQIRIVALQGKGQWIGVLLVQYFEYIILFTSWL